MKEIFENPIVEHSVKCHSVDCLLSPTQCHITVFHFDTKEARYFAESLQAAALLWLYDGKHELLNVGRIG